MMINRVRNVAVCRRCRKELVIAPKYRASGRFHVEMRCPRCGTLSEGDRYMQAYMTVDGKERKVDHG